MFLLLFDFLEVKMKFHKILFLICLLGICLFFSGCISQEIAQYGIEDEDTIALNLTRDPNVGRIFVTHLNGEATGAYYRARFLLPYPDYKYINPLYIKLNGKPIIFTLSVPVVTGYTSEGNAVIQYKRTELRLTKLADLKPGEVITLKWMYQTQTFAFMDATGNIIQQTIPQFN